jgi:hypothetical protein
MNQGTEWGLLMKKNRSQKSCASVPLRMFAASWTYQVICRVLLVLYGVHCLVNSLSLGALAAYMYLTISLDNFISLVLGGASCSLYT